ALGNHAVDPNAFALARPLEPDANLVASIGLDRCRDMKALGAEAHEILVARTSRRTQNLQVVDRLEQIRFALAVVADHDKSVRRRCDLDVSEVAKVARGEADQSRR